MMRACCTYPKRVRTPVVPGIFAGLILFGVSLFNSPASADVADVNWELNRQQGFNEYEKQNTEFNKERLSGLAEAKKDREDWEKKNSGAIGQYKLWKEHEGRTPDENSPEYREDLKERTEDHLQHEKDRERYAQFESRNHQELLKVHPLKECREYDLCDYNLGDKQFDSLRVPQKDRLLYGNKPLYMAGGATKSGVSESFSRGGNGGTEFAPPPATPSGPEFYEPEVPPPPPPPVMPEGGFDEQIPPPIFDEPGY